MSWRSYRNARICPSEHCATPSPIRSRQTRSPMRKYSKRLNAAILANLSPRSIKMGVGTRDFRLANNNVLRSPDSFYTNQNGFSSGLEINLLESFWCNFNQINMLFNKILTYVKKMIVYFGSSSSSSSVFSQGSLSSSEASAPELLFESG